MTDDLDGGLRQTLTPQFIGYIVISMTAFAMCLGAIEYLGIPARWAFVGGFLFSIPVELLRDKARNIEVDVRGGDLSDA